VLAEFDFKGSTIYVVQTLDLLYVVGKQVDGTRFTVPTDEEMAPIADELERMVDMMQEDADDALDDFDPDDLPTHR